MADADVTIRTAVESDFDAVGLLCVEAYSRGGHLDPDSPYTATLLDAAARSARAELLVAVRDGSVVGTVTVCPLGSPFAEVCRAGETEFRFLAVAPSHWRSGIGVALVAACEQRAREAGSSALVLCVIESNEAAHRLYRGLGFERQPERDWEPVAGVRLHVYRRPVPYRAS